MNKKMKIFLLIVGILGVLFSIFISIQANEIEKGSGDSFRVGLSMSPVGLAAFFFGVVAIIAYFVIED